MATHSSISAWWSSLMGQSLGGQSRTRLSECAHRSIWVSQVVLVVKNPPATAGNIKRPRFDPWCGRLPGGGQTTHSSILFFFLFQQVQVAILFQSTAQNFTYTLVVFTMVLLSRLQMNPQKLIYLKLNIHNKTRGIQMFRTMQKGRFGWCFHWVPCLFGVAKSRT